jgi:hypothetical protein
MRTEEDMKNLLNKPDFILSKRFGNSLKAMEARYPDGAPDHIIAGALSISEEDVKVRYARIVEEFQKKMNIEL